MPEIMLTEEQAQGLSNNYRQVAIKNPDGTVVGFMQPILTPQVVADMKRRAKEGPWFTSEQVRARFDALEAEWQRTGGFDPKYMEGFLAELDKQDPPRPAPRGPGE